jgi:hypothetical protein
MRRRVFSAVFGAAFAFAFGTYGALSSGCSGTDERTQGVIYEGGTTSDALTSLLDDKIIDSLPDAAEFTWPSNGDVVPLDPPPTLCWRQGSMTARLDFPSPSKLDRETGHHVAHHRTRSILDDWFGEGTAHAAIAPLSGKGFFLVIASSDNPELLRVFTTGHDYTPDAASLAKLTGAKGTLQATVTTAQFDQDAVSNGPYKGIPVTFTMASAAP